MTRNELAASIACAEALNGDCSSASLDTAPATVSMPTALHTCCVTTYLNARGKLRFEKLYFPLGFPVRVLSNSRSVLAAADESWSSFKAIFHRAPLEISIAVRPDIGLTGDLPPAPTYSLNESLLLQSADRENFIVADLKNGRAFGRVTQAIANSRSYLRYHILEAAALSMLSALRAVAIHAACVQVGNKGVLLCGDSGAGKSTLAFAGARVGWTYVTDDASYLPLDRHDRLVVGNSHQIRFRPSASDLFPELAGRAITPRAAGKPSIEARTSEWPRLATANAALIDHIVFLNRKWSDEPGLIPLPPWAVWPFFKQHVLTVSDSGSAHDAAFSRLLVAPVHEIRYKDLNWAIDRIYQLVARGN